MFPLFVLPSLDSSRGDIDFASVCAHAESLAVSFVSELIIWNIVEKQVSKYISVSRVTTRHKRPCYFDKAGMSLTHSPAEAHYDLTKLLMFAITTAC